MDGPKNKNKLLKRAEAQRRPVGLDETQKPRETLADMSAFGRPERPEHTSEKEHPPGKE